MSVQEAIVAAEQILPGQCAPEGEEDPRWQAIIGVSLFIPTDPETIWPFALKWGSHEDADLRSAIATCLLEHLLEHHFDLLFPKIENAAKENALFGKTIKMCWKFGQAREPEKADKFEGLRSFLDRGIA